MPGTVFKVLVGAGDAVQEGQAILILEAMKMEMPISAPASGTMGSIAVGVGDRVVTGQVLATIN